MVYLSCEDAIHLNHSKSWFPLNKVGLFLYRQVATVSVLQIKICTSRHWAYNDTTNLFDHKRINKIPILGY